MHAVFMVSGVREFVDEFFVWMDHFWYLMPFKNPNYLLNGPKDANGNLLKEGQMPITGKVRYGVYGTYEICMPEEYKDIVLTTLRFDRKDFYPNTDIKGKVKNFLGNMEIGAFRKLIGCEPVPEFKTDHRIPIPEEITDNVRIIPVGVRYDEKEWLSPSGLIHERI